MATPLSLAAIEAECRALGLTDIRLTPGASSADRPGSFTPLGITIHITAGGLGSRTEEEYIRDIINGDPNVPLKANAVVAPDGTLWLNAVGNANHCLYFGQRALDAAKAASFPLDSNADYRGSQTKWSQYSYGVEMIAAKGADVTAAQRNAAVVWAAAIARLHGWSGQETHGHGEVAYDRSYSDPGIPMGQFRRDVMAKVSTGGGSGPAPIVDEEDYTVTAVDDGRFFTKALPAGVWTAVPITAKNDLWGWDVTVNSQPIGGVFVDVTLPEGASYNGRFFAVDRDNKRVFTWPHVASRTNELFVPISAFVWGDHQVGLELYPSADAQVNATRLNLNYFT